MKADLNGKANLLSKYIGNAELGGKLEVSRTEIFSKYPPHERSEAYFEYQICILVMNDTKMDTPAKIKALADIHLQFQQLPSKVKAGLSLNSHAGDNPADGLDVRPCVTADPGWKVKPKSGHLVQDELVNGASGFTRVNEETEDHFCGSFHIVRANKGRSAGSSMHAEITQVPIR